MAMVVGDATMRRRNAHPASPICSGGSAERGSAERDVAVLVAVETMQMLEQSSSATSTRAQPFAEWMLDAFNRAGFCLMASVGHRCGLFDAMRDLPEATSSQIATRAGLN